MLIRITAPHFVAAIISKGGTMTKGDAAPIIRYMKGWSVKRIRAYCERQGWQFEVLTE